MDKHRDACVKTIRSLCLDVEACEFLWDQQLIVSRLNDVIDALENKKIFILDVSDIEYQILRIQSEDELIIDTELNQAHTLILKCYHILFLLNNIDCMSINAIKKNISVLVQYLLRIASIFPK